MKINSITQKDRELILEMHSKMKKPLVLEQVTPDLKTKLNKILSDGCVKGGKIVPIQSTNPALAFAIKQESTKTPGKFRYFFADNRIGIFDDNGKFQFSPSKWSCEKVQQSNTATQQSNTATQQSNTATQQSNTATQQSPQLDNNQNEVLRRIKLQRWFHEPAPTEVEIEMENFEKQDLTDVTSELGLTYSKWFTKKQFPNGFFVYRKTKKQPDSAKAVEKIEVDAKDCINAIEGLWNNKQNPRSYPITPEQRNDFRETAKMCSEPTNRAKFRFRPGLNNKLNDLDYR
jgi:hypothetical protein